MESLGKILNSTFGIAYINNLKRSKDRLSHSKKQCKKIDLKHIVVNAYDGIKLVNENFELNLECCGKVEYPRSAKYYGLMMTDIEIAKNAINKNHNSYIYLCDDCEWYNYENINEQILSTIKLNLPDDWDIIIFGGIDKITSDNISEFTYRKIVSSNGIAGCHSVAINNKIFKKLVSYMEQKKCIGDGLIDKYFLNENNNIYKIDPEICFQNRSFPSTL